MLSQFEYDKIKEMFIDEFLERAINVVTEEPEHFGISYPIREGYAKAIRDMEAALIREFK